MPDLIIKPAAQSGNKVIIQDQAGGAVITTADSGATIANATLNSPTLVTPALGTVATGNLSNTAIVYPAGHIVGHWQNNTTYTASKSFTLTEAWLEITYGANEFRVTGVTATENNILHISVNVGSLRQVNVDGYRLNLGFRVDSTDIFCSQMLTGISTNTQELPGNWFMNYVVPASFTSKTISARGTEQASSVGSALCRASVNDMTHTAFALGINVFEIQV
jgi:hypothetical protein